MHSLADMAPATVLVVDDEPLNIRLLARALSPQYRVKTATCGDKALAIVAHSPAVRQTLDFCNLAAFFGDPVVITAHEQR